ncbi:MAG: DUF2523 domain-containing protein [Methylobacter sp.]|nr:MAG: DUF2523 domain-containing protein [Methylobacter sp.]
MSDTFSSVMLALTGTVTARVMTTLGLGYISYTSIKVLATTLQNNIFSCYALINSDILNILDLVGLGEALHIITAAFVTKAGMMAIKHPPHDYLNYRYAGFRQNRLDFFRAGPFVLCVRVSGSFVTDLLEINQGS